MSVTGTVDELLDHAPCGFASFGDDGRIVSINRTLLERLEYEREELIGRHVETILTIGSRVFYQTHFFPLIRLHGGVQEVFLLLRTRGGADLGMLCNAARREGGSAAVTDCVFLEVQERRKYEEALLRAKRAAEEATAELEAQAIELERQRAAAQEANRAKSTFLAVMSHELRTPLNAIGGYVQLLQMGVHGPANEAQLAALERIDRSQRHLLRLINDVLNLSRIEAGRVDYRVEPVAIAALVTNVLPMVEPQIGARRLQCEVRIPPDLLVRADREKAQQILLNLLTNAVKFTKPGGRIRVEAAPSADRSDALSVWVSDSGVGIPVEMRERIFEPFVQVDVSRTRSAEGTGLGLAISRDLARGMGGELTMSSEVGVGSTFMLTLPAAASMDRGEQAAAADAPAASSTPRG